jgi:tetratricopeptide (TPR) repeat protein
MAALPEDARAVVEIVAVAGGAAPRSVLSMVTMRAAREEAAALKAACHAHLLEEDGLAAYRVGHDLIREVVEADLGAAHRVLLHHAIGQALEGMAGTPPVEALAYHFGQTEAHDKASYWLEQAGDSAAAGFAAATAIDRYSAARARLLAAGERPGVVVRVDEKLGDQRRLLGDYAQAQADFTRALEHSIEPARRAELWRKQGEMLIATGDGDYEKALAAFDAAEAEGRASAGALPRSALAALALSRGEVYCLRWEVDAAEAAGMQALALLDEETSDRATEVARARAYHFLGTVEDKRCHGTESAQWFQRSLARYESLGDRPGMAACWGGLAGVAVGAPDKAEECWRRRLEILESIGDRQGIADSWGGLGWAAQDRGAYAAAEACHRRSMAILEQLGYRRGIGWCHGSLGDAAMINGRLDEADEHFERMRALSEQVADPNNIAWAWNGWGNVALERGNLARAEECFQRNVPVFERIGFVYGVAVCWMQLGRVACERGELGTAVRRQRRARRLAHSSRHPEVEALAVVWQARVHLRAEQPRAAAALLEYGRGLGQTTGWERLALRQNLIAAEIELHSAMDSHALRQAHRTATHVVQQAVDGHVPMEEALARRLLGQCLLAQGLPAEAVTSLRAALALQQDIGATLEAARTRLCLAEALTIAGDGSDPDEARALLAAAQAQFTASGAALDAMRVRKMAPL